MTVVQVITAQCSKDPTLMHLLRCVLFFCAVGDFKLRVKRISGRSNTFVASICRSFFRRFPGHPDIPCQFPTPWGSAYEAAATMDLIHLEGVASDLISSSLAPNSYQTYQSGQSEWLVIHLLPAEELVVILFVAHLSLRFTHSSVRSYLSAVRHMHIVHGFSDPLLGTPQLKASSQGPEKLGLNSEQVTHIYQLHNTF